jgi:hypothetical protein
VRRSVAVVFRRGSSDDDLAPLIEEVRELSAKLTTELQAVRRQAAEDRAAMSDALDFVVAQTAHTSTLDLIAEFRAAGWLVAFGRRPRRDGRGTIYFEHPTDPDHNCSLDLPLPNDSVERSKIENRLRVRIGWTQAA